MAERQAKRREPICRWGIMHLLAARWLAGWLAGVSTSASVGRHGMSAWQECGRGGVARAVWHTLIIHTAVMGCYREAQTQSKPDAGGERATFSSDWRLRVWGMGDGGVPCRAAARRRGWYSTDRRNMAGRRSKRERVRSPDKCKAWRRAFRLAGQGHGGSGQQGLGGCRRGGDGAEKERERETQRRRLGCRATAVSLW